MPRFDVHRLPAGTHVVNVQADLLDHLATRAVVPLFPLAHTTRPIIGLNPIIDLAGHPHVFLAQAIASVPPANSAAPSPPSPTAMTTFSAPSTSSSPAFRA